ETWRSSEKPWRSLLGTRQTRRSITDARAEFAHARAAVWQRLAKKLRGRRDSASGREQAVCVFDPPVGRAEEAREDRVSVLEQRRGPFALTAFEEQAGEREFGHAGRVVIAGAVDASFDGEHSLVGLLRALEVALGLKHARELM